MDRKSLQSRLIAKAWADDEFKRRLLANPGEALRAEGIEVPAGIEIAVVENTADRFTFVLPRRPKDELSERELASATGSGEYHLGDHNDGVNY